MFEKLQNMLFGKQSIVKVDNEPTGRQPIAAVDSKTLERIIHREFGDRASGVVAKLQGVNSDSLAGKNRISAAIIKLANKDISAIDTLIEISNSDFRDVLMRAEYPRCLELNFARTKENERQQIYLADWNDYSNWLNEL
jgi:hypothetical protein